jgi:UDP-glucose 4-epimerase
MHNLNGNGPPNTGRESIFADQRILIIGGTGSLGQCLVKRILSGHNGHAASVTILSRDEAKQYAMMQDLQTRRRRSRASTNLDRQVQFRIGDARNLADVRSAMEGIDIVVFAAAMKQVPTCEYFPDQAIRTNCIGAINVVQAIADHRIPVRAVVGVSTDKACKPVNVMGMTKALQERIFMSANLRCPQTRFTCVRYGNVLASRGSVIPLFISQIRAGGPLTITDPTMTRFLLTLEHAVDTIIAALDQALPGETVVPIAPSATVLGIAEALIADQPIEIQSIGSRPGEKLHEILISEEELAYTRRNGDYYFIRSRLPELQGQDSTVCPLTGELSSETLVLSAEGTKQLLADHGLLRYAASEAVPDEILR